MTTIEIKKRIEELETQKFYINMTDRFTRSDWDLLHEVEKEIKELKKVIDKQ